MLGHTDRTIEYALLHTDLSTMRMLPARDVHTEASILNNWITLGNGKEHQERAGVRDERPGSEGGAHSIDKP